MLLPTTSAPQEQEQPPTMSLDMDGPTFGKYRYATFHAEGRFSTIYIAQPTDENASKKVVALKLTNSSMMSPPHNSEREGRLLIKARHEHVVPLLDMWHDKSGVCVLVFPVLRYDVESLLRSGRLDRRLARMVFDGLFRALKHIHMLDMIHRDVKPANIMLASMDGPAYLIDFGIAWAKDDKDCEPEDAKITDVGTTCYRPPELLFGDCRYNASLDMWAAGCVVAEMARNGGPPLFDAGPVGSELGLIRSIFTTLGTPNNTTWPSARLLPDWGKMKFKEYPATAWNEILPGVEARWVDFVSKTVCYEPLYRLTASDALEFFS